MNDRPRASARPEPRESTPARESELIAKSLAIIRAGQHRSGAFIAAPTHPPYAKAWIRDGSFCAMALDRFGEHQRAVAFHRWVARVVAATPGIAQPSRAEGHYLRARFPLAYPAAPLHEDPWGNYQLDGPAFWLIALADHVRRSGTAFAEFREPARAVGRYLATTFDQPCFDVWEERGDGVHGSTLAALVGGFRALVACGADAFGDPADRALATLRVVRTSEGAIAKSRGSDAVDSSLLWTSTPCAALAPHDPLMARTRERVRAELNGGRTRYRGDAYYGGGEWLVLAGIAGCDAVAAGEPETAEAQRAWIEAHAEPDGALPEQVAERLERPEERAGWVDRHGPPASPLLWSHATYLLLRHALAEGIG